MSRSRFALQAMCAALLISGTLGCHHSANSSQSDADPAQQQFLQAFLAAHEKKDLEAQENLVDWDDITEYSREHFVREYIQAERDSKISSAKIEEIPGLNPRFAATYNIPPEKFLVVVYADPRSNIQLKYPIGRKDGRYYFAMSGLTPEAFQRNARNLKQNR